MSSGQLRALALLAMMALAGGRAAAQDAIGCDVYAPTPVEFIQDVERGGTMFIGRVHAFRLDSTTLASAAPDCPTLGGTGASEDCKDFWSRVVTVQYRVEAPISGLEDQNMFESIAFSPTDPCQGLAIGQLWLVAQSGWRRIQLAEMPSMAVLASLRQRAKD